MQRVERDRGALARAAAQPELARAVGQRRARGVEERRAPGLRRQAQAAAAVACAQAAAPKRAAAIAPAGVERERDAHAVAAGAAAREALAGGLGHAPGELEVGRPQHQTTALARRSSSAQRGDGVGGEHAVPVLAERAEAEPQRAARRLGRRRPSPSARGSRSTRALAQAGPAAAATPCSSSSATSAWPWTPSSSASEWPGVRSARSPTIVTPATCAVERRLVAVADGAVARVAARVGARGRERGGQARRLRDALGARPQRALLPAAEEHRLERREAAPAEQARALRAAQLVPGDGGRDRARQRADVDRERRAGLHGVEVQRHAALGADRGGLGDRLDHARQVAGPDQAADEVARAHGVVERARRARARRRRPASVTTSQPARSSASTAPLTAGCSSGVVTMRPAPRAARPRIAMLSASEAPPVKTTSACSTPSASAAARARARRARAAPRGPPSAAPTRCRSARAGTAASPPRPRRRRRVAA